MHGERRFNKLLHFVRFSFNLRFSLSFSLLPSHSKHDSGSECTPGESKSQDKKEKGNYIMYARATSGDKLNNNKFSICSVRNISQVLEKKRSNCFVGTFLLISSNSSFSFKSQFYCYSAFLLTLTALSPRSFINELIHYKYAPTSWLVLALKSLFYCVWCYFIVFSLYLDFFFFVLSVTKQLLNHVEHKHF